MNVALLTRSRYDRYRLLKQLSGEEGFMWCLRPGCQNGQIYDPDDEMVICAECSFEMCFRHRGPWHAGLTCLDYAANQGDPNSRGTREWIERNSKACPNQGCGVPIEKNLGCDHMTCKSTFIPLKRWSCILSLKLIRNGRH